MKVKIKTEFCLITLKPLGKLSSFKYTKGTQGRKFNEISKSTVTELIASCDSIPPTRSLPISNPHLISPKENPLAYLPSHVN